MHADPLLSVRIITYNHKNYISDCIDSVLMQQTSFPFEIVIGEDDSTDGTREIVKTYAEKFPDRIRLFLRAKETKIKINGVMTGRFNFVETIRSCRGKFIAMLDGDDCWTDPRKLQQQVDFLTQNPEYVVCFHDADVIDDRNRILRKGWTPKNAPREIPSDDLRRGFAFIATSTMCFRNVIPLFPDEFYRVMNGDVFITSLLGAFGKGRYMPEILPALYRLHPSSMYGSLSSARALDFSIDTRGQLAAYYKRINLPALEEYFRNEQAGLARIRNSRINLFFFILRKRIYRFQINFLGDKPRRLLHFFRSKEEMV